MKRAKVPLILVNFKAYGQAIGDKAVNLAKICQKVSLEYGLCIAVAPQTVDIRTIACQVEIPVFAQHIDPIDAGSHTGWVWAGAIKEAGATGVILNHSEHPMHLSDIEKAVKLCKEHELTVLICAPTPYTTAAAAQLKPDFIAIEPPELIGTGIPVSRAKPNLITDALKAIETTEAEVPLLCGAGITIGEDVEAAFRLGAKGILVASGVVKAKNPEKVLRDFAEAIRRIE